MYHRLTILFILFLIAGKVHSQQADFRMVDTLSYRYYTRQQWKELESFGKDAVKQGYDYYYLDLRLGIASYERGNRFKSEKFFRKALKHNNGSAVAREYLYWIYRGRGDELNAWQMMKQLPDSTRKRAGHIKFHPVQSLFAEGGPRFSGNNAIAGNVYYVNAGIESKLGNRLLLTQAYTFCSQHANEWGQYDQHQYFMGAGIYLNKGWQLDLGVQGTFYNSSLEYRPVHHDSLIGPPPPPGLPKIDSVITHRDHWYGTYKLNSLGTWLGYSKQAGRFSLSSWFSFMYEWEEPSYYINRVAEIHVYHFMGGNIVNQFMDTTNRTDTLFQPLNRWSASVGMNIGYTLPVLQDRFTVGAKFIVPFSSTTANFIFSPYLSARLTNWCWLGMRYFSKGALPVMDNGGAVFYNSYDRMHRISVSATFLAFKRLLITLTYQHDKIEDSLTLNNYQLNSILCGLKFRF